MDLSFVILTWNSEAFIRRCLQSIESKCRSEGLRWEAIVVDNGSKDGTRTILSEYRVEGEGRVDLIALDKNRGTTYPRNIGYRKAQGRCICTIDSDTELLGGSLRSILRRLETDRTLGIVAPRLVLANGAIQNSVKKFPTLTAKLLKIPRAMFKIPMPNLDFYPGFPFTEETEVDSAISACWFFERRLMSEVGMLDENIYYSPEDLDYCLRVRMAGCNIVYWPEVEVLHHTQQISHRNPLSKVSLSHFAGLMYYFRKHRSWFSKPEFPDRQAQRLAA